MFFTFFLLFCRFSMSLPCVMSYMSLSSREKNLISENNSLITPFLLCSCFRGHPTNTTSQNIGRDRCMGRPPPQILGGPSPPVPLGLRPWTVNHSEAFLLHFGSTSTSH